MISAISFFKINLDFLKENWRVSRSGHSYKNVMSKILDDLIYLGRLTLPNSLKLQLVVSVSKHMKTPRWFTRNRLSSHLRIASAVTLMSTAAAMAFVAISPSGPFLLGKSDNKGAINKFSQSRVELLRNKLTVPGPEREGEPTAVAEEDYANRAAGTAYVPFALTRNANTAWTNIKARGRHTAGSWTLAGPSTANSPGLLSFTGAAYTTSGRITALAVDPSCNVTTCRVWAAAAGGGVWRTNNALSGSGPTWTFISGSFATNAIGAPLGSAAFR